MADWNDLIEAFTTDEEGLTQTSVRLPTGLHRSIVIATEMGMDKSITAVFTHSLRRTVGDFVRNQALADHFREFPSDVPALADVANRRIQGSGHPGVSHPDLVSSVAERVESRRPSWALEGDVDRTVDEVLDCVELLVDLRPAVEASA